MSEWVWAFVAVVIVAFVLLTSEKARAEAAERRLESAIADGDLVETSFGVCLDCDCDVDLYRRGNGWVVKCCACEREFESETLAGLRHLA